MTSPSIIAMMDLTPAAEMNYSTNGPLLFASCGDVNIKHPKKLKNYYFQSIITSTTSCATVWGTLNHV